MPDEPQTQEEPPVRADAVEDLAPKDAEQDISGGAIDSFMYFQSTKGGEDET